MNLGTDRRSLLKGLGTALAALAGGAALSAAESVAEAAGPARPALTAEILPAEPAESALAPAPVPSQPLAEDVAGFLSQWAGTAFLVSERGIVVQPPEGRPYALLAPVDDIPIERSPLAWEEGVGSAPLGTQGTW